MAEGSTCTGCDGGCSTTCNDTCKGRCSNTCLGGCDSTCRGDCYGGCKGDCKGSCSTECDGTCVLACEETCNETCKDDCYWECLDDCKGYCAAVCQTYCQYEQTFSKNDLIGGATFSWSNAVCSDQTINITASDWNDLKSYIRKSVEYCGGDEVSSNTVSPYEPIRASEYNDLAGGLDLSGVTADVTLITATIIDNLRTTYNDRQIDDELPDGEFNNETGPNSCCQAGMTCMPELLEHQICGDQTESACGNQVPGKQVGH